MPKTNGSGQATVLTPDQMKSLMEAAPTQAHRVSWQIMRFTGSRITETLRLTWGAMHVSCPSPQLGEVLSGLYPLDATP